MVGGTRFELVTSWTRTRNHTKFSTLQRMRVLDHPPILVKKTFLFGLKMVLADKIFAESTQHYLSHVNSIIPEIFMCICSKKLEYEHFEK